MSLSVSTVVMVVPFVTLIFKSVFSVFRKQTMCLAQKPSRARADSCPCAGKERERLEVVTEQWQSVVKATDAGA